MTDMQKFDGAILKTDTKGRVQTPAARRESLLGEFERSGLSASKFAALVGIKYQTFAAWAARRRKQGVAKTPAKPVDPVRWLEAVVQEAQAPMTHKTSAVILRLPGGAQLELVDSKQAPLAAALLRALESPCERPPSC
jgi:hypothetical protein